MSSIFIPMRAMPLTAKAGTVIVLKPILLPGFEHSTSLGNIWPM